MNAGVIVHARAWLLDEEVADFECLVGEVTGFPDRKAGWIAVPVFIGFGDVSHIVDLLAGVVLVYVLIKADSYVITLSISSVVSARHIVIPSARDL